MCQQYQVNAKFIVSKYFLKKKLKAIGMEPGW